MKPLAVAEPLAGTELSCQYESAPAFVCRSVYRPVSWNVTAASESRSITWRTSPVCSPSSAAAFAGRAAGIAPSLPPSPPPSPDAAEPPDDAAACQGHRPLTSTA